MCVVLGYTCFPETGPENTCLRAILNRDTNDFVVLSAYGGVLVFFSCGSVVV